MRAVAPAGIAPAMAVVANAESAAGGDGAGALLRAARRQQGMHIAMLAAALKVPPAKIEALEAGRYDELPDATFTRALALSVCRVLKIDPAPVLAQLPQASPPAGLDKVSSGLNTPFRDRSDHLLSTGWAPWRRPAWWTAGLLVIGAAAFVLLPPGGIAPPAPVAFAPASAPEAVPASAAAPVEPAPAVAAAALPAAAPEPASAPAAGAAPAPAQGAVLSATAPTWVQAVDGSDQVLISRVVAAGESVELAGPPPIRIRIGNVAGARLEYQGKPVDLAAIARNNIATVELR